LKGENRVAFKSRSIDEVGKEYREKMIERLLNNEKILTLVYDKTFYPDVRNVDINISAE
jgi:hypothetical protein